MGHHIKSIWGSSGHSHREKTEETKLWSQAWVQILFLYSPAIDVGQDRPVLSLLNLIMYEEMQWRVSKRVIQFKSYLLG